MLPSHEARAFLTCSLAHALNGTELVVKIMLRSLALPKIKVYLLRLFFWAQSAVVFQAYGAACRSISGTVDPAVPLSYSQVFTAGEPRVL